MFIHFIFNILTIIAQPKKHVKIMLMVYLASSFVMILPVIRLIKVQADDDKIICYLPFMLIFLAASALTSIVGNAFLFFENPTKQK